MEGQVRGIARMIEREEYCVDILQQTAALRAAVDALSILVLEDHVQGCVRTAAERGEADQYVDEVIDVVRRTLGRPVRGDRPLLADRSSAGTSVARPERPSGGGRQARGASTIRTTMIESRARAARSRPPTSRRPRRSGNAGRRRAAPRTRSPPRRRSLLARALDILAEDAGAEARLADLLDLLARTVGARRAAIVADGPEPTGRRRDRPRRGSGGRSRARGLARRRRAAQPRPTGPPSAPRPDRGRRRDRIRRAAPVRSPSPTYAQVAVPTSGRVTLGFAFADPADAALADVRLPRTLARHAAVALALVTDQLEPPSGN